MCAGYYEGKINYHVLMQPIIEANRNENFENAVAKEYWSHKNRTPSNVLKCIQ